MMTNKRHYKNVPDRKAFRQLWEDGLTPLDVLHAEIDEGWEAKE